MSYTRTLVFYIIFLGSAIYAFRADCRDRFYPYGLIMRLNEKHAKGIMGEDNGVSMYWGKPDKKDTLKDRLDKIEWLSGSYQREVKWRRSIFFGTICAFVISLMRDDMKNIDINRFITGLIVASMVLYFSHTYYDYHVNYFRTKHIKGHIRALKRKYKLPYDNPIYQKI